MLQTFMNFHKALQKSLFIESIFSFDFIKTLWLTVCVEAYAIEIAFTIYTPSQPATHTTE